jgi:hypothetical protein
MGITILNALPVPSLVTQTLCEAVGSDCKTTNKLDGVSHWSAMKANATQELHKQVRVGEWERGTPGTGRHTSTLAQQQKQRLMRPCTPAAR